MKHTIRARIVDIIKRRHSVAEAPGRAKVLFMPVTFSGGICHAGCAVAIARELDCHVKTGQELILTFEFGDIVAWEYASDPFDGPPSTSGEVSK